MLFPCHAGTAIQWSSCQPSVRKRTSCWKPKLAFTNLTKAKGKSVRASFFTDADLGHDWVTGGTHCGTISMLNLTPIGSSCKLTDTVETATCGSEFTVARISVDNFLAERHKLRALGGPIDGPSCMLGDNKSIVLSSAIQSHALDKRHNFPCHHRVRECIAATHNGQPILKFSHISGKDNPAEQSATSLPGSEIHRHFEPLLHLVDMSSDSFLHAWSMGSDKWAHSGPLRSTVHSIWDLFREHPKQPQWQKTLSSPSSWESRCWLLFASGLQMPLCLQVVLQQGRDEQLSFQCCMLIVVACTVNTSHSSRHECCNVLQVQWWIESQTLCKPPFAHVSLSHFFDIVFIWWIQSTHGFRPMLLKCQPFLEAKHIMKKKILNLFSNHIWQVHLWRVEWEGTITGSHDLEAVFASKRMHKVGPIWQDGQRMVWANQSAGAKPH